MCDLRVKVPPRPLFSVFFRSCDWMKFRTISVLPPFFCLWRKHRRRLGVAFEVVRGKTKACLQRTLWFWNAFLCELKQNWTITLIFIIINNVNKATEWECFFCCIVWSGAMITSARCRATIELFFLTLKSGWRISSHSLIMLIYTICRSHY